MNHLKSSAVLILAAATLSCAPGSGSSSTFSMPRGLPYNPSARLHATVTNQSLQSWEKQPKGTSTTYRGNVTIADAEKRAGLGSHEMRAADVRLTFANTGAKPDALSKISYTATVNNTPVSVLMETGSWDIVNLWQKNVEATYDNLASWVPRTGSSWSNTFTDTDTTQQNGINATTTDKITVSFQPKYKSLSTPAGTFLCDRICITGTSTLNVSGAVKPGFKTSTFYTPIEAEFFVSDEVPGLVVRHNFTTWHVNLLFLLLHENSHITGTTYPNAAVNAKKPGSYGYYEIQQITRP